MLPRPVSPSGCVFGLYTTALRPDTVAGSGFPASIKLPSRSSDGVIKDARNRHDVSADGIEVSGLIATSAASHPVVGDSVDVEFTLRNVGSEAVALDDAFAGART